VRIDDLDISDEVLDKIERKHGVSWEEVEEVCRYSITSGATWRVGRGAASMRCSAGRLPAAIYSSSSRQTVQARTAS
jgi:hypothetical protein